METAKAIGQQSPLPCGPAPQRSSDGPAMGPLMTHCIFDRTTDEHSFPSKNREVQKEVSSPCRYDKIVSVYWLASNKLCLLIHSFHIGSGLSCVTCLDQQTLARMTQAQVYPLRREACSWRPGPPDEEVCLSSW